MAVTPLAQYTQQDLKSIPVLGFVPEGIAGDLAASAATVGRLYRNTTTGRLRYVRDAATVVTIDLAGLIVAADIAANAAIAMTQLATNPLARANHTGNQLANTVSDFDTQVRTSRLDQLAVPTAAVVGGNQRGTNWADPQAAQDLATQAYVLATINANIQARDFKDAVRFATAAALPANTVAGNVMTMSAAGVVTIDSGTLALNDRLLVKNEAAGTNNGIYTVTTLGTATVALVLTRATDADVSADVTPNLTVGVEDGATNADTIWWLTTNAPITLGTTALTFAQLPGGSSYVGTTNRITVTGNAIDISSAYVGQTSVTTLGTITTGIWTGTAIAVANGGTGSTTAVAARTALSVPRAGGVYAIGALVAGTELVITHNLGTQNAVVQVRAAADRSVVGISARMISTTTAGVTADVAVAAGILELVISPVD